MRYFITILLLTLTCEGFSQVLSNNGAVASVLAGTVVNTGSLENNSGTFSNAGILRLTNNYLNTAIVNGNGDYYINGNWNNNGTYTQGTGTINFIGAIQQNFSGSGSFSNLVLNNPGGLLCNNDLTVTAALTLTNGSFSIGSGTFTLNGAISGSGTLSGSSSANLAIGGNAGTLNFTPGYNTIKDLILNTNATATLGTAVNIIAGAASGTVIINTSATLTTGGNLVLKSDANGTARVGNSPGTISGNVIVERYIPGRRKYRLITSTVTTSESAVLTPGQEALSIWGNWQNSGINTTANVGTLITGGSSADGFDTGTPNASLYTYDDVNRKYVGYTTANGKNTKYTSLKAGIAYFMFVYGDRLNSVNATIPHNTLLIANGTLKTGDQAYHSSSAIPLSSVTGRFTLLGNPFASPIDWSTIPKTDLANTYWGWDPNLASTGGYITVNTTGNVTLQAPYSGSTGLNQYIQPGQGFFVKTTGTAPVLTIREEDKVSNFNGNAFRSGGRMINDLPLLAINLQYMNAGNKILADGVLAAFDTSFSKNVGPEDATKMVNSAENVAILNDTSSLSIDARKLPQNNDTLYLNISKLVKPQYTLQIFAQQLTGSGLEAYLQDRYLNTLQPLLLNDTNNIVFNVSSGTPASSDINRFRVVFRTTVIVLPVRYTSIKAVQKNKDIQVTWDITEESGIHKYSIERSDDGINFIKKGEVYARGNSTSENYQWLDTDPALGNNYYRVRAVQSDSNFFLSKIVVVKLISIKPAFTVFPNPVKNKAINIQLQGLGKGKYTLLLFNQQGQQIIRQSLNNPGGAYEQIIYLNKMLPGGLYYIQIKNEKENYKQTVFIE